LDNTKEFTTLPVQNSVLQDKIGNGRRTINATQKSS